MVLDFLVRQYSEISLLEFETKVEKLFDTNSLLNQSLLSHPLTKLLQTVSEDHANGDANELSQQFKNFGLGISYRDLRLTCTGGWYNHCHDCGMKIWPWQMVLLRNNHSCENG